MLKLVAPARDPRRQSAKRRKAEPRAMERGPSVASVVGPKTPVDRVAAALERAEAIGDSVQRVVASGRRQIIDVHGQLDRTSSESRCRENPSTRPRDPAADSLPDAALRRDLADIHDRLLFFSTNVELEMDRLEMLRQDIERVAGAPRR